MHELSAVQKFDSLVEFTGEKNKLAERPQRKPNSTKSMEFQIWKSNSFRTLRAATGR
jgi:hypothetical protein